MEENKPRTALRRAVDHLIAIGKLKNDKELSDILGLSQSTISGYLSGVPGKRFIREFEEKFELKLKDFDNNDLTEPATFKANQGKELVMLRAITNILVDYVLEMRANYYNKPLKDEFGKTGVIDEYERALLLQLQRLRNEQL